MAVFKQIVASASYITPNDGVTAFASGTAPIGYTYGSGSTINPMVEPVVEDFVLRTNPHMRNPGVFTQGTAPEGTASNPQNE